MLWLPKMLPGQYLSFWRLRVTLLQLGLLRALHGPAATSRGCPKCPRSWLENGWSCSRKLFPSSPAWPVLWNPQDQTSTLNWKEIQLPARQLGVQLHSLEVRSPNDFDKAFEDATRARAGAIAIMPDPVFVANLKRIADLAIKSRFPSIFHLREFVGLWWSCGYGPDRPTCSGAPPPMWTRFSKAPSQRICPVEQPTKLKFMISLKTAKQIGLTIPPNVLARADKVIR